MTIDKAIELLIKAKEQIGGNEEFVVMSTFGENDYIKPDILVSGDLEDQDGNEFKVAFVGESGGEELTVKGTPHYRWKYKKYEVK